MTITQIIQTSPVKANELFGKLADTSDGAVKTREKLFAELKEELELHARLEEQHLFPVLRKHKETKDLVADAVNDNRQARALLAELERMPKDAEDFPKKLTELRRVFQQHVRDEKKELLPAVRKALSDEEAEAVAGKIEAGRAQVEDAKREEAEQRRAEARREREAAEELERRSRQTAAALTRPVETLVEGSAQAARTAAQTAAQTGAKVLRAGSNLADDGTRRAADILGQTAQPALERLEAFSTLPLAATRAFSEAGEAWRDWAGRTTRTTMDAAQEMARLNSPVHLAQVQGRMAAEAMQAWIELGQRLTQATIHASEEMMKSSGRR